MRSLFSAAVMLVLFSLVPAHAETKTPDLKGTWTGKGVGVFVTSPGSPTNATYGAVDIVLKILEQKDRRFSGTIGMSGETKPIAGVVTADGGVWWSEPGGFVQGRMTDPDTIDGCFLRVNAYSQLAACEALKRQK